MQSKNTNNALLVYHGLFDVGLAFRGNGKQRNVSFRTS